MTWKTWKPFVVAGFALVGAALSRWHGGGFVGGSPKILKNFLWAIPFALVSAFAWWKYGEPTSENYFLPHIALIAIAALVALGLCMIGKSSGHGGGIDLARSDKEPGAGRDPEKVEYLILWLRPLFHMKHSRMYDALILALSGLFAVSGAVIVIGIANPLAALPVAIGGVFKAVGYVSGWKIYPDGSGQGPDDFNEATELGEALAGLFAFTGLGISFIILI